MKIFILKEKGKDPDWLFPSVYKTIRTLTGYVKMYLIDSRVYNLLVNTEVRELDGYDRRDLE